MSTIKPGTPSAETRQRLLDAGVRLFAEHGFKGVSVRDLSAAAEVNIAAINYHFGGKRELYRTGVTELLARTFAHYPVDAGVDIDGGEYRADLDAAFHERPVE